MRIGVLGGSFDPVHAGHIGVARAVADALNLPRVLLVPAAQAPLREGTVRATGEQRAEIVRRAIEESGDPRLELCDLELRRGGLSYTVDTLRALRAERPEDDFVWIVGADQLARLPQWREPGELARLAEWAAYARPGYPWPTGAAATWRNLSAAAVDAARAWRVHHVEAPRVWDLSSTQVRARLLRREDLRGLLADKVIEYIRENGLYRGH